MKSHYVEAKIWTVTSAKPRHILVHLPPKSLPPSSLPCEEIREANSTSKCLDSCDYKQQLCRELGCEIWTVRSKLGAKS